MTFKDYLVTWTDIYNHERTVHVKLEKPTESHAIHAIPHRGDIFKRLDKIEEAIWEPNLNKFIPKPDPYANSKVPVIIGDNLDFVEYSIEYVPNQGEIPDFETAHDIAVSLLDTRPYTVINQANDGMWWVGRIDPIKKAQVRPNYDYGEGLYMNLDKYKSVEDFRKKRRNKRKKDIKNILDSRPDRYKVKK